MASAEFFEQNPPNRDTARQLLGERERVKPNYHPVQFLASRLIASSSEELQRIDTLVLEKHGDESELEGKVWRSGAKYISRIMFGSVILGIYDAKNEGNVYIGEVVDRINMELGKTLCSEIKFTPDARKTRQLTQKEKEMIEAADETYSSLFEHPERLPAEFAELLTSGGHTKGHLIDNAHKWRDLASIVLDAFHIGSAGDGSQEQIEVPDIELLASAGLSGEQIRRLMALRARIDKRGE